jgi:hypothetical protein
MSEKKSAGADRKKLAFIVLYGQLRKDPCVLFARFLRPLLDSLEAKNFDVRVVAHQWYASESVYDTRKGRQEFRMTNPLENFMEKIRPDALRFDRPMVFSTMGGQVSSNTLSQMYSRTRSRDLLAQLLRREGEASAKEAPVFFCRSDFGREVSAQILEEYLSAPAPLTQFFYLSDPWKFNDNFLVMSAHEFCVHFDQLFERCLAYLSSPSHYQPAFWENMGWVPENLLEQRFRELGRLQLVKSTSIPDFR